MALDAVIKSVKQDGVDVVIELEGRLEANGHRTLAGQDRLTIENATYVPEIGMAIWGGSGSAHLVLGGGKEKRYRRVSYTRLREL